MKKDQIQNANCPNCNCQVKRYSSAPNRCGYTHYYACTGCKSRFKQVNGGDLQSTEKTDRLIATKSAQKMEISPGHYIVRGRCQSWSE